MKRPGLSAWGAMASAISWLLVLGLWLPGTMAQAQTQGFRATTLTEGLDSPWGLAFLPDGRMLVTERPGRLRLVSDGFLPFSVQAAEPGSP